MKFTEILTRNRELGERLTSQRYKIGLISNITISQLKEVLELTLRLEGVNAEVEVGNYDAIVQDSHSMAGSDALVIFWEAGNLVDGLHHRIDSLDAEEVTRLAERVEGEMDLVLRNAGKTPLVVINRFSPTVFCPDAIGSRTLVGLCKRLNNYLEQKTAANLLLVEIEPVIASVGLGACADFRQYLSSKSLYSLSFLRAYAEAVKPVFLAARGRSKKLLVLDCDNTLWGGVVGEDGVDGVRLGGSTMDGKAFQEVQSLLLGLQREGVLLALCSKNNPAEVDAMLQSHAEMLIKDAHLVAKKVNWQDKASNLRELATELNLGLDSFVFLDDSPFELGLIQDSIPEIQCVQVPAQLSEYPALVRKLRNAFFSLSRTLEDQSKTEMYRQEAERKADAQQHASIEDYLVSLGLRLKIYAGDAVPVARAAQLSQKTNQFNLTTRRYTEADIQQMLSSDAYVVAMFSVADRYGDYGVTGMAIVRQDGELATVDTFLMSCRVIGRNIEYAFFDQLVQRLQARGVSRVRGEYFSTPKNDQVSGFYESLGFQPTGVDINVREIALGEYKFRNISYVAIDA